MDRPENTRDLVGRASEGDRDAFRLIVERVRPRLLAFICRRLGTHLRHEAEVGDIFQETILRALQSVDGFEWNGEDSIFNWLATIAEYRIRSLGRRVKNQARTELDPELANDDAPPSELIRRMERFDRLEAAFRSLPAEYREVLRLARIEGMPIKDIALKTRKTPGAVRHLLLRALRKLQARFGDETESFQLPDLRISKSGEHRNDEPI